MLIFYLQNKCSSCWEECVVLAFLVVMEMNYNLGQKGIPQSRGCGVIWWVERASWRQRSIYSRG